MAARTVILSDTHMGRPHATAGSPEALRALWQGADHLIMNGDLAELHHPRYRGAAAWTVVRLKELCEQDGVKLTMLAGNHDPYLTDKRYMELADGQIFITHGDVLHSAVAPWSRDAPALRRAFRREIVKPPAPGHDELDHHLACIQAAAQQECFRYERDYGEGVISELLSRPLTIPRIAHYWWIIPRLASTFLDRYRPHAKFMIFGHTHHHGIWHRRGRTLINTGAYGLPAKPRAVIFENETLHVHAIKREDDVYVLADRPLAQFDLNAATQNKTSSAPQMVDNPSQHMGNDPMTATS